MSDAPLAKKRGRKLLPDSEAPNKAREASRAFRARKADEMQRLQDENRLLRMKLGLKPDEPVSSSSSNSSPDMLQSFALVAEATQKAPAPTDAAVLPPLPLPQQWMPDVEAMLVDCCSVSPGSLHLQLPYHAFCRVLLAAVQCCSKGHNWRFDASSAAAASVTSTSAQLEESEECCGGWIDCTGLPETYEAAQREAMAKQQQESNQQRQLSAPSVSQMPMPAGQPPPSAAGLQSLAAFSQPLQWQQDFMPPSQIWSRCAVLCREAFLSPTDYATLLLDTGTAVSRATGHGLDNSAWLKCLGDGLHVANRVVLAAEAVAREIARHHAS